MAVYQISNLITALAVIENFAVVGVVQDPPLLTLSAMTVPSRPTPPKPLAIIDIVYSPAGKRVHLDP
nr:hypothetical protein [Proteus mirabilis]